MFQKARIKLTLLYLLIIMAVSGSFSLVIYKFSTREIERFSRTQRLRIERRILEQGFFGTKIVPKDFIAVIEPEILAEARQRLILILLGINGAIFIFSGSLGYFLAGKTLEPIKEMVDKQNIFVSDASHELRTPLTALGIGLEVFLRDKKQSLSKANVVIRESLSEISNLQALSERLLKLAQFQSPLFSLNLESVSLNKVVSEAIEKLKSLAKEKKIRIVTNVEEVKVIGNFEELSRLLIVLLDNAIKYSLSNQEVEIKVQKENSNAKIQVLDHGIGINEKDLPHIFDRFYRADLAREKVGGNGFGLGLAIAKKITELHRGSIKVESVVNQGTTFTVLLPLKPSAKFQI